MDIDHPAPAGSLGGARPFTRGSPVLACLASVGLLAAPAPTTAQAPDSLRQDTVYEIEPIAVRAVRPSATAGGVSAIEVRLDSVRFRPAPLLEDVLRELPLIQVRTNSRGQAQLALRGAEDRQIAILLDGVPLTLGWDHRTDLSVIPLTAAQSVQVVRGLSSVLHGPNVLGGVVNIGMGSADVTRIEPLTLAGGLDDTGGYTASVAGAAGADVGDGRLTVRAGLGHRARDGLASPPGADAFYPGLEGAALRVNSDLEHSDAFASVRYTRANAWVSASATAFEAERGVPPELHEDAPRLWRYPETWRAVTIVAGGIDAANALGVTGLNVSLGVDRGGTLIHDFALPAAPGVEAGADPFYTTLSQTEESDDLTRTARVRVSQRLPGGATVSAAATYASIRHDEVITVDPLGAVGGQAREYGQRLWSLGTELDLPFDLAGAGFITGGRVSGGIALDGMDTPETGGTVASGPSPTEWGGRLGLSASTTGGGLLFHTALSRRGRFPSLRELYSEALGRFEPNPALEPEILTMIEAGFTSRVGRYDLQMVGFHQRLDNAIVRGAPPAGSSARYQRVNRDRIRSTGVEILAGYSVGRFALETEVTLQDVEVVEPGSDGVRPEYEPAIAGGVGGTLPLVAGIEAGAEIEYWGRQFCSVPDPGQEQYETLAPGTRADIQFARSFRLARPRATFQHLGVELAVDNVADSAVYDQCGLPQPGRTLRLQFRVR